jgi:hypothetical protein
MYEKYLWTLKIEPIANEQTDRMVFLFVKSVVFI